MKAILLALIVGLVGCATESKTYNFAASFKPGECTVVEAQPSWLTTMGALVCFDDDGRLVASTGGMGKSGVDVGLEIIGPVVQGATIGAAGAAIGRQIENGVTVRVGR